MTTTRRVTQDRPEDVTPRLRMTGVRKAYPGTVALDGAELEVLPGEVHCLLGENGAGKSTLMKVLAGAVRPDAGRIEIDGKALEFSGPVAGLEAGVSVIYQELDLVPDLTVAQNLYLGSAPTTFGFVRSGARRQAATQALEEVGAQFGPDALVRDLSIANQQLTAIARSLASDASVIVMDEPSATLTATDLPRIFSLIRSLAEEGRSVVYISHRIEEVLEIGDRATVLRDGATVGLFRVADTDEDELVTAIVGHRPAKATRTASPASATPVLSIERAVIPGVLDVSGIEVRPGQVVGLAGLGGAGRTTLLSAVFGAVRADLTASVRGESFRPRNPGAAVRAGIGLVPEDRKQQGLLRELSVARNAGLAALPIFSLSPHARAHRVSEAPLSDLRTRYASPHQPAGQLSGGNQQKVVLAKWLARGVDILLLDEPTRGIDIGAKAELYRQVHRIVDDGAAVLMASSELAELYANADLIYVMFEGRNIACFDPSSATEEEIARAVVTGKVTS